MREQRRRPHQALDEDDVRIVERLREPRAEEPRDEAQRRRDHHRDGRGHHEQIGENRRGDDPAEVDRRHRRRRDPRRERHAKRIARLDPQPRAGLDDPPGNPSGAPGLRERVFEVHRLLLRRSPRPRRRHARRRVREHRHHQEDPRRADEGEDEAEIEQFARIARQQQQRRGADGRRGIAPPPCKRRREEDQRHRAGAHRARRRARRDRVGRDHRPEEEDAVGKPHRQRRERRHQDAGDDAHVQPRDREHVHRPRLLEEIHHLARNVRAQAQRHRLHHPRRLPVRVHSQREHLLRVPAHLPEPHRKARGVHRRMPPRRRASPAHLEGHQRRAGAPRDLAHPPIELPALARGREAERLRVARHALRSVPVDLHEGIAHVDGARLVGQRLDAEAETRTRRAAPEHDDRRRLDHAAADHGVLASVFDLAKDLDRLEILPRRELAGDAGGESHPREQRGGRRPLPSAAPPPRDAADRPREQGDDDADRTRSERPGMPKSRPGARGEHDAHPHERMAARRGWNGSCGVVPSLHSHRPLRAGRPCARTAA